MDDRSLVASSQATLDADIATTDVFDDKTGSEENVGKRQLWRRGDKKKIEHLGIEATPDDPTVPILPAAGWGKLAACLKKIGSIGGSSRATRKKLVACYAKPLWSWASPLFSLPPKETVAAAMKAIVNSKAKWWCKGQFWADHIEYHPIFSAVFVAAQRISEWDLAWSPHLEENYKSFMRALGLEFVAYKGDKGIQFRMRQEEENPQVRKAFGRRAKRWSDESSAAHLLRTVARARALETVNTERNDAEGVERVDLEAASQKPWQQFRASLTPEETNLVEIFRAGASSTKTRRCHSEGGPKECVECDLCGAKCPRSLGHYVTECAHFKSDRKVIEKNAQLKPTWWATLPRVTSKSGCICVDAHACPYRRSEMQVAVCQMALNVMRDSEVKSNRYKGAAQRELTVPTALI